MASAMQGLMAAATERRARAREGRPANSNGCGGNRRRGEEFDEREREEEDEKEGRCCLSLPVRAARVRGGGGAAEERTGLRGDGPKEGIGPQKSEEGKIDFFGGD